MPWTWIILAALAFGPAALVLNILVAGVSAVRYLRAGRFEWAVFWPFALAAIPAAFIAGRIELSADVYRPLLAIALGARKSERDSFSTDYQPAELVRSV